MPILPHAAAAAGISAGHVKRLFLHAAEAWTRRRIRGGQCSGEGLIDAVRDRLVKCEASRKRGKATGP